MWHFISSIDAIPKDRDLILAVVDSDGLHALKFRCRCGEGCWINVETGLLIDVSPELASEICTGR
jgi:hypothetical protein